MMSLIRSLSMPAAAAGLVLAMTTAVSGQAEKTPPRKALTLEERQALAQKANALRPKSVELFNQKKYAEAARLNLEILEMYRQVLPEDQFPRGHPAIAAALGFQAAMLKMQGKDAEAVVPAEQALAMYDRLYPPREHPQGHPATDRALDFLGMVLYDLGGRAYAKEELRPAIGYFQRAVQVYERRYPKSRYPRGNLDLARAYNGLGGAYLLAGEHHRAVPVLRKAFAVYEALNPKASRDLARSLNNMGSLLREQGEYGEARKYQEQSLAPFRAGVGGSEPGTAGRSARISGGGWRNPDGGGDCLTAPRSAGAGSAVGLRDWAGPGQQRRGGIRTAARLSPGGDTLCHRQPVEGR
jgi:tetratricopeptide (TPR) repeat protein